MATTHGPDLEAARRALERLMDDTCEIWRNPTSNENAVLDPETGKLVTSGTTKIYPTEAMITADPDMATEGGPVSFRVVGEGFTTTQTRVQGGDAQTYRMFNVKLPINECPALKEGDVIICVTARRDSTLPGTPFVVREDLQGTFAASRKVMAERRAASAR